MAKSSRRYGTDRSARSQINARPVAARSTRTRAQTTRAAAAAQSSNMPIDAATKLPDMPSPLKPHTTRSSASAKPTGERGKNVREYSRKAGAKNYKAKKGMATKRKLLIGIVSGIVALLAIAGIAAAAFISSIDKAITIDPNRLNNLNEVLSVPAPNEPYYTLLLGSDARDPENTKGSRSDSIMLVRCDSTVPQVTIVSINRDTRVIIDGYGTQKINAAYAIGQEAGAVKAVEKLCDVDISYYAEIDFSGVIDLVDKIGGVTVNVPLPVEYNGATLAAGKQKLNGKQALLFSRCRNFDNGDFQRVVDQRILLQAIAKKVLSRPKLELPDLVQTLAGSVKTNLQVPQIVGIMESLQGIDEDHIYMATLPADAKTIYEGGYAVSYVLLRDAEFEAMMTRVKQGLPPIDPNSPASGMSQTGQGDDSVTGKTTAKKSTTASSSKSTKTPS